ncbi:putative uncharacterized protein [Prevotella sp. CAG:1124]|nr:putative uncharacterized protein [Prevotella sp. CAG:1124]
MVMRKLLFLFVMSLVSAAAVAQQGRPFDTTIRNEEYKIYIRLNLYDKNITVPGQDVLGEVDGYFGSTQSSTKWIVVASRLIDGRTAEIEVVNDYGSEDFTATLKVNDDGTYEYKKDGGSTLKFAVRGKWQKIPVNLELVRK